MPAPQQKPQKQFPFVAFAIGEGIGIVLGIVIAELMGADLMAGAVIGMIAGAVIGWLVRRARKPASASEDFLSP